MGNRQDVFQNSTDKRGILKKAKNIWKNHKGKTLLSLTALGILVLGS